MKAEGEVERTFERVASRADEQTHEVDVGVFLLRDHHLVVHTDDGRPAGGHRALTSVRVGGERVEGHDVTDL